MINTAKIKGRMAELELTQSDVAKALGLSPSTVSQKINNVRALSLDEAVELSALLNIDVGDFGEFFLVKALHSTTQINFKEENHVRNDTKTRV